MRCLLLVLTLAASTTIARPLPYVDDSVSDVAQDPTYVNTEIEPTDLNWFDPTRSRGDQVAEWNRRTVDGKYMWPDGKFRNEAPPHGPHTYPGLTDTNPDGSISTTNDDGTITTPRRDGSIDILYPDGRRVIKKANGKVKTRYPDGTVSNENDDGTITTTARDGTETTYDPRAGDTQKTRETQDQPNNIQKTRAAVGGFAAGFLGNLINSAGQAQKAYCALTMSGCH